MRRLFFTVISACAVLASLMVLADDRRSVDVARFDDNGKLIIPANLDEWIFIGSSLGMGYSQENFDPDSPGMFQIARMEPQAYRSFKQTGQFADGTMISLHFYGSQNEISINRAGFVMDDLHFGEIHYKDSERFPDGFNFYTFNAGQDAAEEIALPNECVACHKRDAAYDGVFVQFYPAIHEYLPDHVRDSLAEGAPHGGH